MFNSVAATMIARHEEFLSLDVSICVDAPENAVECEASTSATGHMFLFLGPEAVQEILTLTRSMVS
jgi:hypothetical protein